MINKSFDFALQLVELYKFLTNNKKEFIMAKQLLKSGTSVGANVKEAIAASNKKDFVNNVNNIGKRSKRNIILVKTFIQK